MLVQDLLSYGISQRYSWDQIAERERLAANAADFGLSGICHAV
jgi:hypothetical protein